MAQPNSIKDFPSSGNILSSSGGLVAYEPQDGLDEWSQDGRYIGPEHPMPPGELKATLEHLCLNVAYLRSWFDKHERALEAADGVPVSSVWDNFIEASMSAKTLARMAGLTIDYSAVMACDWTPKTRPQRPEVGPQALYVLTGHDIGLSRSPRALFTETCVIDDKPATYQYEAGVEWLLYHLEEFDEPSRHIILAGCAVHFGMPFDVLMGGML